MKIGLWIGNDFAKKKKILSLKGELAMILIAGKKFISKIFGINPDTSLKTFFEEKKEREEKEKMLLRLALLSGSIRRIK
jgi:hypothetical protein